MIFTKETSKEVLSGTMNILDEMAVFKILFAAGKTSN